MVENLLVFVKNNNMFVLNVGKDKSGKPTSENNSVVDYAISSGHLLRKVEDFEILEFSKLFPIYIPLFPWEFLV